MRALIAVVIAVWLIVQTAEAQPNAVTSTPTPITAGVQSRSLVDVFFPEAVRFEWRVAQTADRFSPRTLTLVFNVDQEVTIQLTDANILFREPETVVVVYWRVPFDDPPALFSEIRYRWLGVDAAAGEAIYEDVFRFQDTRLDWTSVETEAVFLAGPADMRSTLAALVADLERVWGLASANTGLRPRFRWLAYRLPLTPYCYPLEGFSGLFTGTPRIGEPIDCREGITERVIDGYELVIFRTETELYNTLITHLVSGFYPGLFSRTDIPVWFQRGLIELYDPRPKDGLLAASIASVRARAEFALNDMTESGREAARSDPWWGQAYGMLLMMQEHIGREGIFDLARRLEAGAAFDAAVAAVSGLTAEALFAEWRRWVVSPRAISVFALSAYQPATPTPSPTPTPTVTRTPTPTATATFTATFTPTGVLSATPFNTATLTPSATPAPSTATPRPPGSLPTPTPAVAPPVSTQQPVDSRAALLIGFGVIVIMLIVIFIRSGRR
ncbi:MAG: hypothetical protein ACUVS2_12385 [Candidatus Flexifilum sp.]|jgi:hypothetical protein